MSDASSKFNTEFESIADDADDVDKKRRGYERNLFKVVLVLTIMGFATAGLNSSVVESIVSWFSPSGGNNATIIYHAATSGNNLTINSTQIHPTFNNTFVRFNVSFSDVDLNDWHTVFVCNGTNNNYTLVQNNIIYRFKCHDEQLCNYSNTIMTTDNPMSCDYYPRGFGNQTQNYTAFILDSGGKASYVSGTFAVDRPPYIISIVLTKIR
jgi:hypothetical protein